MLHRLYGFVILLICVCGTVGATGVAEPAATVDAEESITVVDEEGNSVTIPLPVERVAVLVPQAAEALEILQRSHLAVARTSDVAFPVAYLEVPDVGSTNSENVELLLETAPDLIISRAGFLEEESKERMARATGAPILQFRGTTIETSVPMIETLGRIFGAEERAAEFISFVNHYTELVEEQVSVIPPEGQTEVFFQSMGRMFWTGNRDSSGHQRIVQAGGVNIAADEEAKVPRLSAEWVLERDPELIIHSYSGARRANRAPTLEEMREKHQEIMTTPGLKEVRAVTGERSYVIDVRLVTGPQAIIGKLYYAKWISPEFFADLDPEAVHRELLDRFYGVQLEGTWVYPESAQ